MVTERYVPLPEGSTPTDGGAGPAAKDFFGNPITSVRLVRTEMTQSTELGSLRAIAHPDFSDSLDRVPVKPKLRALLAMVAEEVDPVKRANLQACLRALLRLPDDVLLQVLQHPDLGAFVEMLDAVILGEVELWWIEEHVEQIHVVPVTSTMQRIDVGGRPAFTFDSAAAARSDDGGPPSSGLKQVAPSTEQTMNTTKMAPDATAFAVSATNWIELNQFSLPDPSATVGAPVAQMQALPPSQAPSPSPTVEPSAGEGSRNTTGTQTTMSSDVFADGNMFQPGMEVSNTSADDSSPTEGPSSSTPSASSGTPGTSSPGTQQEDSPPSGDPSGGNPNDEGGSNGESAN